ncbi:MAG: hypothetical protein GY851_07575 [bacterium]|nr:hypothetical protein [bacterium]
MPPSKLLDTISDNTAEMDEVATAASESHAAALQSLLNSPEGRNPAIWLAAWEALVEPLGLMEYEDWVLLDTVDYVEAETTVGKPILWSATVAAAKEQADVGVLRELIAPAERGATQQNRAAAKSSTAALKAAGLEGLTKERMKAAVERRNSGDV